MGPPLSEIERECLTVLWLAKKESTPMPALKLAEISREVKELSRKRGRAEPAPATLSSCMRKLVLRGLVKDVVISDVADGSSTRRTVNDSTSPRVRSPHTAYQVTTAPGDAQKEDLIRLAESYPPTDRLQVITDVAKVCVASGLLDQSMDKRIDMFRELGKILNLDVKCSETEFFQNERN